MKAYVNHGGDMKRCVHFALVLLDHWSLNQYTLTPIYILTTIQQKVTPSWTSGINKIDFVHKKQNDIWKESVSKKNSDLDI